MAEKKTNYPFELVARAAQLFGWNQASLQHAALGRELRHASIAIVNHVNRLFPELDRPDASLQPVHTQMAAEDLLKILDDIKRDKWWSDKFTTMSMLDKFIVTKERAGQFRVAKNSKKIQDILKRF